MHISFKLFPRWKFLSFFLPTSYLTHSIESLCVYIRNRPYINFKLNPKRAQFKKLTEYTPIPPDCIVLREKATREWVRTNPTLRWKKVSRRKFVVRVIHMYTVAKRFARGANDRAGPCRRDRCCVLRLKVKMLKNVINICCCVHSSFCCSGRYTWIISKNRSRAK